MNLLSPSQISALLAEFGFSFKKKFGQNFLINNQIPEKIARASLGDSAARNCIEIGPGIGVLTGRLAVLYEKVTAFEIDASLLPVLSKTLAEHSNVTVINEDILNVDLKDYTERAFPGETVNVCANLPYYITTPIILQLLQSRANIGRIVVMMQKEVAQRLTAKPGSEQYGAITPVVEYYAAAEKLFDVSPGNFMPKPTVTSTVIALDVRKTPPVSPLSEEIFFQTIRGAFARRRKTLLNSLLSEFPRFEKNRMQAIIEKAGLSPAVRGECLDIRQLALLSDEIYQAE